MLRIVSTYPETNGMSVNAPNILSYSSDFKRNTKFLRPLSFWWNIIQVKESLLPLNTNSSLVYLSNNVVMNFFCMSESVKIRESNFYTSSIYLITL